MTCDAYAVEEATGGLWKLAQLLLSCSPLSSGCVVCYGSLLLERERRDRPFLQHLAPPPSSLWPIVLMYNTHDIYSLVLSLLLCVDKIIREREKKKLRDRWRHRAHLGARYKWQRGSKRTGQWKKKTGPSFLKMHNDVDQERNVKSAASLSRRRRKRILLLFKGIEIHLGWLSFKELCWRTHYDEFRNLFEMFPPKKSMK